VDAAAFLGVGAVCEIDYGDAGVPMLTETHRRTVTRKHIIAYCAPLVVVAKLVSRRLAEIRLVVAVALNIVPERLLCNLASHGCRFGQDNHAVESTFKKYRCIICSAISAR
jgi:heme O synthase-like polyprenyltransferase